MHLGASVRDSRSAPNHPSRRPHAFFSFACLPCIVKVRATEGGVRAKARVGLRRCSGKTKKPGLVASSNACGISELVLALNYTCRMARCESCPWCLVLDYKYLPGCIIDMQEWEGGVML